MPCHQGTGERILFFKAGNRSIAQGADRHQIGMAGLKLRPCIPRLRIQEPVDPLETEPCGMVADGHDRQSRLVREQGCAEYRRCQDTAFRRPFVGFRGRQGIAIVGKVGTGRNRLDPIRHQVEGNNDGGQDRSRHRQNVWKCRRRGSFAANRQGDQPGQQRRQDEKQAKAREDGRVAQVAELHDAKHQREQPEQGDDDDRPAAPC